MITAAAREIENTSAPWLESLLATYLLAPFTMVMTMMTEATPMTTPMSVSTLRILLLNGETNIKILRDNDQPWTRAAIEESRKMCRHGSAVMRDQNPPEIGCFVEDIGIRHADNPSRAGIREIDYRLTAAQAKNDLLVEVRISLEPRPHALELGAPRSENPT